MDLTGIYRLVRCEVRWSDGEVEFPYGKDPEGLLVYAASGYFSGHVMRPGTPKLSASARRAPAEEMRAAFLGYIGYYGSYSLDEKAGTVTHRVLGSWHPNWVGTDLVRHFSLEAGNLVIQTPPIRSGGRSYRTLLDWQNAALKEWDGTGADVY